MKVTVVEKADLTKTDNIFTLYQVFEDGLDDLKRYSFQSEEEQFVLARLGDFNGKIKENLYFRSPNIFLIGTGNEATRCAEQFRKSVGYLLPKIRESKVETIIVPVVDITSEECAGIVDALILGLYQYKEDEDAKLTEIIFEVPKEKMENIQQAVSQAKVMSKSANFTRRLAATPSNMMTPKHIAGYAKELASENDLKLEVLGEREMSDLGMNALLAVSSGSCHEAQLIVLKYEHPEAETTLAIVGKALTFDAGGLSLKPSKTMKDMKFDKSGGSAVLGAMKAIAKLKPKVNVVGVIPSSENVIGSHAFKPGDVLKAYNGKTIEVSDTDAEGRLILCDALAYCVDKYKPNKMINIATLTGAVIQSLGRSVAAIMGNSDSLCKELIDAGAVVHERLWQMPLYDEYKEMMKSQYADLINLNEGREAGVIQGSIFLQEFVGDTQWGAIDIGGTAWNYRFSSYIKENCASGFGARLFTQWALDSQVK